MNYLLAGVCFLLLVKSLFQDFKIARLVSALRDANSKTNEHRTVTADHEKKVKGILLALTKLK